MSRDPIIIDADAEIASIRRRLDNLQDRAPGILKNSINAAARKVRKQMIADVKSRYAIKDTTILRKEEKGAPKLITAREPTLTAEIRSRGGMHDIMSFSTRPNTASGAASAQILGSGSLKSLEFGGIKAFVTTFASGHTAIVQRDPSGQYTSGRQARSDRYGDSADMTRIKKLLSLAVPIMLGNEDILNRAENETYDILQREIQQRIDRANNA